MLLFIHFCFNYPVFCKLQNSDQRKQIYLHVGKVSQWSEHSSLDVCNFNALQAAVNNILSVKDYRKSKSIETQW